METGSDEVLEASASGDVQRMLQALDLPAQPIDRHFLLLHLVEATYARRHDDAGMRERCRELAGQHLEEFPGIAQAFQANGSERLPRVPTFQLLATLLSEDGSYDEAVAVCERALSFGLMDGTKSGFEGRIQRIRKQHAAHVGGKGKPAPRRPQRAQAPEDVRAEQSDIPRFQEYNPDTSMMGSQQRNFYTQWREAWENGTAIAVDGNVSYLFCYVYRLFHRCSGSREPMQVLGGKISPSGVPHLIPELSKLFQAYRESEPKFVGSCQGWVSDCYLVTGDHGKALELFPRPELGARSSTCTDHLLSLKLAVGERANGGDLLTLVGPQVTQWGREHLEAIRQHLDDIVRTYEHQTGVDLLREWSRTAHSYPCSVFRGTPFSSESRLKTYSFSGNEAARKLIRRLTREAENAVRADMGMPPVRARKQTSD